MLNASETLLVKYADKTLGIEGKKITKKHKDFLIKYLKGTVSEEEVLKFMKINFYN